MYECRPGPRNRIVPAKMSPPGLTKNQIELVQFQVEDRAATLTLNDPPANTYAYDMMHQLDTRILDARMDGDVRVIIISGSGDKFFCAGANIPRLTEVTPEFRDYFCL